MANNIRGITIEIDGKTEKLQKALSSVNKAVKTTKDELKEVEKGLKLDPKNTELLAQKQQLLTKAVGETKDRLDVLKTAEAQVEQQFKNGEASAEQYRAIKREVAATEEELKNLENAAKSSNITLEKVGSAFGTIGDKATSAGQKMLPVTAAITAVGTASVAAASEFEDSIAKLSTIADTSKETGVPLEELEKQIKDLSDQTGISSAEIAENVYNAISAGQKTGDAVSFVENATKLAKAGFTDSGAALDILTTAMNAYGMEADKVTNVSDMLIMTQNLGKTTVNELASAMGKVIPTANANNVQMDQLCASYAILTANGIATAESTTYLNSMLNELGKGGTTVDGVLREKTGKTFSQLSEEGMSLSDVLDIINTAATEDGKSFSDMWSSAEAGKAALVLLGDDAGTFNDTLSQMQDATGATDEAFAKLDTTSNKVKIAINQVKNVAVDLGTTILDSLQPIIESVVGKIKDFTEWFKNLNEQQKQTVIKVAAVVAAIGPALIIFGKICTAISSIITVVGKIGPAIKAAKAAFAAFNAVLAANPAILIVTAIVAVIAILVTLYNKCEWFRNGVNKIFEAIKAAFFTAFNAIKEFFTVTIPNVFNTVLNFVKSNWQGLLLLLVNPFAGAFKLIYDNCDSFRVAVDTLLQNIKQFFVNLWNGIVAIFQNVGQWFTDRFTEAYTGVTTVFSVIGSWFAARWNDIKTALATVATWFLTMFTNAYTNVTNVFAAIGSWFAARWNDIKTALAAVATWFLTMFTNAYTNVTNVFAAIGSWFGARWTEIKTALASVPTWFKTQFDNAWTNIKNAFANVTSFFSDLWEKIKGCFVNVGVAIGSAVGDAFKSAINSCLSTIEGVVNKFIGMINGVIGIINEIPGVSLSKIDTLSLPRLAKGGVLREGTAMVAEAGPELLSMVNGKAVVTPLTGSAVNTAADNLKGNNSGFHQEINITSPKALSPYEVARQTRIQTRAMVIAMQRG